MVVDFMGNSKNESQGHSRHHQDFSPRNSRGTAQVFSNATFRAMDGKASFGFAIWFDGCWVHARSINGAKVTSLKEDETRDILCG